MATLYRLLGRFTDLLTFLAGVALNGMMVHVCADVLSKAILRTAIVGTLESVTYYYMVAVVFFPVAMVQRLRSQIVVDILTTQLPRRTQAAIEGIVGIACLAYVYGIVHYGFIRAARMTEIGESTIAEVAQFAIWPSRWIVVVSFAMVAIYIFLQILNDLTYAARGKALFAEPDVDPDHHAAPVG